jgi:hypothetical protein
MTLQQILDEARGTLDDQATPYLWSDVELVSYANRAEERLCEEAYLISDSSTPVVCTINLQVGVQNYAKHPSIVSVTEIWLPSLVRSVTKKTRAWLESNYHIWRSLNPGTPVYFCEEIDTGKITLIPTPNAAVQANLTVFRRPLTPLSVTNLNASPEIPAEFHKYMKNGILALAYEKQDTECYDPQKAMKYAAMFEADIKKAFLKNDKKGYSSQTVGVHKAFI